LIAGDEVCAEFRKASVFDRGSRPFHQIEIEMKVVDAEQPQTENFFRLDRANDMFEALRARMTLQMRHAFRMHPYSTGPAGKRSHSEVRARVISRRHSPRRQSVSSATEEILGLRLLSIQTFISISI